MAAKILRLGQLSQRERTVLALIRGGSASGADMIAAFATLSHEASEIGLVISTQTNPIVHCDEKKLLAWLTLLQRRQNGSGMAWDSMSENLLRALRECAVQLDRASLHLDYRNAVRFLHGAQASHEWREPEDGEASPRSGVVNVGVAFGTLLYDRVLGLVAEKGVIAAQDLNAAGASHHVIGVMRKRGMLRRIRHGLYALGRPELMATTSRTNAGHAARI